jgi:integrase
MVLKTFRRVFVMGISGVFVGIFFRFIHMLYNSCVCANCRPILISRQYKNLITSDGFKIIHLAENCTEISTGSSGTAGIFAGWHHMTCDSCGVNLDRKSVRVLALESAPVRAADSRQDVSVARRRYQRGQLIWKGGAAWGRWREDVIDPETGRVHRKHVKQYLGEFDTKKLAFRELENRLAEINSPSYRPRMEASFQAFAERWKKDVLALRKKSTQIAARSHIDMHILPAFRKFAMRDITPFEVQSFVTSLPVGNKSKRNILGTLASMHTSARAWQIVAMNWFDGIVMPEVITPESRYFTSEEAIAIITAADEPYRTFYWIAAETGIRLGEACALRPSDFNLPLRAVVIRWNSVRGEVISTKSKRPRAFALSAQLADYLKTYIANKAPSDFIFSFRPGKPWCGDEIVKRHLRPLLKTLGIEQAGFHAFRHCNATILDHENVPLKVRQERLGHAHGERLTVGVYGHATNSDHRLAADKIGRVLCANVPDPQEQLRETDTNGRVM